MFTSNCKFLKNKKQQHYNYIRNHTFLNTSTGNYDIHGQTSLF